MEQRLGDQEEEQVPGSGRIRYEGRYGAGGPNVERVRVLLRGDGC